MQGRWNNCNIPGRHLATIIDACFLPDVDVCVFRDGDTDNDGNPKDIYRGPAKDLPSLENYRVIDIQYDFYLDVFFVEVK